MQLRISEYIELTKPRILMMVLITASMGYFLASSGEFSIIHLSYVLLGIGCSVGGAATLNHYLEREIDKKMHRTANRPLPQKKIKPMHALFFGILLLFIGSLVLFLFVNNITMFLVLTTALLYVLVYTPLKRITWWNTFFGAIPGAVPPLAGWAAAGDITIEAWVLFAILFAWQHPHFYAIAWMYREDYARGGFKMLPVVEPDGKSTFRQVIFYTSIMVIASLCLYYVGEMGYTYLVGAIILGAFFYKDAISFCKKKQNKQAKQLLKSSVIYLPLLLILICLDKMI